MLGKIKRPIIATRKEEDNYEHRSISFQGRGF